MTFYFDNAATSFPKPENVLMNMIKLYSEIGANPGRSGHIMALKAREAIEKVRGNLAQFLNIPKKENLVFTFNGTDSLNMAIQGVLNPGDEVITTVLDHNSVSRPLNYLNNDGIIKIIRLQPQNNKILPEDIFNIITPKTKLVIINHASNVTGWVQDLKAIGEVIKKHSQAYFLVDASQTAGIVPINVQEMKIDLLAFTGHKGLLGPTGTGGLFVSDNVKIRPYRTGGSGGESDLEFQPDEMPAHLEAGTENLLGIIGLGESLNFIRKTGPDTILDHERKLRVELLDRISNLKEIIYYSSTNIQEDIGVIGLNIINASPVTISTILDSEFNIAVRSGLHCAPYFHKYLGTYPEGCIRISFGFFNTMAQVEHLFSALKIIAENVK